MKYKLTILLSVLVQFYSFATTYEVGHNKPFKSIKSALKNVKNGDSLLVYEGVYKEGNIVINKEIKLIGKNYPVLDGQKKF